MPQWLWLFIYLRTDSAELALIPFWSIIDVLVFTACTHATVVVLFFAKEAQDSWIQNTLSICHQDSWPLAALMDHQCPSQIKKKCLNKRFIIVQPMWLKWNLCSWIITNGGWEYGSILRSVSTVSLFSNNSMLCRCGGTVCLVATRCCSIDSIVSYVMKYERGFGKKGLAWNVLALSANSPLSKLVQLFLFWREIYYWTLEGWSYSLPLVLCYTH